MLRRDKLDPDNKKYRPLYRPRSYDQLKRKISKMTEGMTWFKRGDTYDKFKNDWKAKMKTKGMIRGKKRDQDERKEIICAMFVPPSAGSLLMKKIEEAEEDIKNLMDWDIKIVEQSGVPLGMCFLPSFPLLCGCPTGPDCVLCHNTAVKCNKKSVIYRASCTWCKDHNNLPRDIMIAEGTSTNDQLLLQADDDVHNEGEILTGVVSEKDTRATAMNGMNNISAHGVVAEDTRAVAVNGMNNSSAQGGVKDASVDRIHSDHSAVYIGETSRPFRARVYEHMQNLKNGNPKSFIISHWMEEHSTSTDAPEFKWQIVDSYKDALRRQLGEGLYIMKEGVLNKKNEFNANAIYRMQAQLNNTLSEEELHKEIEERRAYKLKIKNFVLCMKKISPVFCDKNMSPKKNVDVDDPNQLLCCRSTGEATPISKRKRDGMETSTPILERRETTLIDMEEDSPINKCVDRSCTSDESGDIIPTSKVRAGLSNEIDVMAVTPPKEYSPDTMDKKLALHTIDIVKASVNNEKVLELREQVTHVLPLSENTFSKRDDLSIRAAAVDGMNRILQEDSMDVSTRAVGMNGMNKNPLDGDIDVSLDNNGAVGMDGMNKTPLRGGNLGEASVDVNLLEKQGKPQLSDSKKKARMIKKGGRKLETGKGGKKLMTPSSSRVILGKGASSSVLSTKGCLEGYSPKRPTPLDVDSPTSPAKRKKSGRARISTPVQQRLTDMWKAKNKKETEEDF